MKRVSLYFHTIKHLKIRQIVFRILNYIYQPTVSTTISSPLLRSKLIQKPLFLQNKQRYFSDDTICFLNQKSPRTEPILWQDKSKEKLWLYHLHYFDALNSEEKAQRDIAFSLLENWVDMNPPFIGVSWEPYPLSLRIVNMIQFATMHQPLSDKLIHSLYLQARYLNRKCEYHLLGNHLFENYKALCFAGLFFNTPESQRWFKKGYCGLQKQIAEQLLPDGGHFELSPMYHAIILKGMLDLDQFFALYGNRFPWKIEIEKQIQWLQCMKRNDHEISYFNDAVNQCAHTLRDLFFYAEKQGYKTQFVPKNVSVLSESGFVVCKNNHMKLIVDAGEIGPSYLPGHGHADTLSFECMIGEHPLFINLGTSCYGNSDRRFFERSTQAHNTVEINHKSSSEVWGGFRVARRASIMHRHIQENNREIMIEAAHNGYTRLRKKLYHTRKWLFSDNSIRIDDVISQPTDSAVAYFHLHPDCIITNRESKILHILCGKNRVKINTSDDIGIIENNYAEAFGMLRKTKTIQVPFTKKMVFQLHIETE